MKIAYTTLSSKIVCHDRDKFSALCVDAVIRLKVSELQMMRFVLADCKTFEISRRGGGGGKKN